MIMPDYLLKAWAESGGLQPFDRDCINPASVDLRWSGKIRFTYGYKWGDVIELEAVDLRPGDLVLLDTLEYITMPTNYCGMMALKSSMGRLGLEHMHAGFFDPGFCGTATLEMMVMSPWTVHIDKGQRIVQLVMMQMMYNPETPYNGRYQGQTSPEPNR